MTALPVKKFLNSELYDINISNLIHQYSGKDEKFYYYLKFGMLNAAFSEAIKNRSERLLIYLLEKENLNELNWNHIAGLIIKYDFVSEDSTITKLIRDIFSNVTNWTCVIAQEARKKIVNTVLDHINDDNLDRKEIIKYSAESGDIKNIEKYTEILGNFPKSILEGAAEIGDIKIVQYALEQDEIQDTEEEALIALQNGHVEIYELLKENGNHENTSFFAGMSCDKKIIHQYATDISSAMAGIAYRGDINLIAEYLENYKYFTISALIGAVKGKQPEAIDYILSFGQRATFLLNVGLMAAVRSNCLSLTKYFVEQGADNIKIPLEYAEKDGHERIVEYLKSL